MSSAPVVHTPDMKAAEAHAYICAEHGTFEVETGVDSHLWGGAGNYVVDRVGERNFENYREEINNLGELHGCHTCGRYQGTRTPFSKRYGKPTQNWVCDHQPPLGIIPDATEWHLYPQCLDCSDQQRGRSIIYVNSFKKHVGEAPSKKHQDLFWGQGRAHRPNTNYGANYSGSGSMLNSNNDGKKNE